MEVTESDASSELCKCCGRPKSSAVIIKREIATYLYPEPGFELQSIEEAAESGCLLCTVISAAVPMCIGASRGIQFETEFGVQLEESLMENELLQVQVWPGHEAGVWRMKDSHHNALGPVTLHICLQRPFLRFEIRQIEDQRYQLRSGDFTVPSFNLKSKIIFPSDPTCDEALVPAKAWIDECVQNHEPCRTGRNGNLPKRVLEIKNDRVSLKEPAASQLGQSSARYACLSHCWGPKGPKIKLTSLTEEQLLKGISIDNLPKTFAQAAEVCRQLGISYLWIDALCIRQDSESDWQEAASTMGSIYADAFITIAALCGQDSDSGLRPYLGSWRMMRIPNTNFAVQRFSREFSFENEMNKWLWPLLDRAWAYQERRLSHRILYFSGEQLNWGCRTIRRSEDGTRDKEFRPDEAGAAILGLRKYGITQEDPVASWHSVIEEYSPLSLTFESDRLPALAAIAHHMIQLRRPDEYIAGLWKDSLLLDLGWDRRTGSNESTIPRDRLSKTIPSWSWASLPGEVSWFSQGPHIVPNTQLISVDYTPLGPVQIGAVKNAIITLRGPMLNLAVAPELPRRYWLDGPFITDGLPDTYSPRLSFQTRSFLELNPEKHLATMQGAFCAIILYDQDAFFGSEFYCGFGLILQKISDTHAIRVGTVRVLPRKIDDSGNEVECDREAHEFVPEFIASLPVETVSII